ncbi:unnamed protein product [Diatraea saccharalis]|uniref:DNA mismatch repair protein S5 domain-containing protein n=1 Tax=Diatraea saccharalis TaxID=40085 RepID=A0A9P0CC66_9NEOP|nr:unnamed protein product [Diatraea saccharalis]
MDVVTGYAIHNNHVGFTLKKFGENTDLKTPIKSSVIDNVRIIHGNTIARELMEIKLTDPVLKLNVNGYITNVNYSNKKGTLLLFINHRLVDSQAIKKAVESVYSTYLPKNAHSFVYLSLELDPKNVDVNVHPTKHEVQFLYEEQIIEKIKSCIETKLLSCNSSRVMYTQARLPGATAVEENVKKTTEGARVYANNMVRVNADVQKIDKFFPTTTKVVESKLNKPRDEDDIFAEDEEKQIDHDIESVTKVVQEFKKPDAVEEKGTELLDSSLVNEPNECVKIIPDRWKATTAADQANATYIDPKESFKTRTFKYERIETKLTSVKQLRLDVENKCNKNLREILANLIFIACIDIHKSLIQHSTKLYLCDTTKLTEELFYETMLYDFQNFGLIKLSNPLSLEELLVLGLSSQEEQWNPELGKFHQKF